MKERLIIRMIHDRGFGFATRSDGSEVYLDVNTIRSNPGLYVGQEVWASVLPPRPGKANPIARDIQLHAPATPYVPFTPEEAALWKLFLELKTQYHSLRLARPLPVLDESIQSWADELNRFHEGNHDAK